MPKEETNTPAPAAPQMARVEVLVKGTEIGGHNKAKGRRESIPQDEALRLQGLGLVKIIG